MKNFWKEIREYESFMDKLKPCPNCGGKLLSFGSTCQEPHSYDIECHECGTIYKYGHKNTIDVLDEYNKITRISP